MKPTPTLAFPALTGAFNAEAAPRGAASLLHEAREHERAGRVADAVRAYQAAIDAAGDRDDGRALVEALRRLGSLRRRAHELAEALELVQRSYDVARELGDDALAAEALNGIALVHLERGHWDEARSHLRRALEIGSERPELRGRIQQNLGVIANIQGDFRNAMGHYRRSLDAFRDAQDQHGCMIAYHNLGMISADRQRWDDADEYFRATLEIAASTGDVRLRGLALLNRAEVDIAKQRYEEARRGTEEALKIFDQLGERDGRSAAYKFLGVLYRETGRPLLAEARLKAAIELASNVGAAAEEAEASRELAILYQALGRNQDALRLLNTSHRLFRRLKAHVDLVDVSGKVARLESVYLEIVRDWGRSIESTDSYTHGHSERVATYGATLAAAMGLDEAALTTIRLGAYLHDVGKVRVPHEILNKPGKLTDEEFGIMKMHPVYGIELLASVEFPWDLKPIIRSHHEKVDGSGYPDRLRGDEIPLTAQLICVVDVFDALTTTRSYRGAMTRETALAEMHRSRHWWEPEVFDAFLASVGTSG